MKARMFPTLSNTSISSNPNWTKPSVSFKYRISFLSDDGVGWVQDHDSSVLDVVGRD